MLADPFAVSFHAIVRHPPPPGGRVVVYGAGALGSPAWPPLRRLYPTTEVAVVARFPAQAEMAKRLGLKPSWPTSRDSSWSSAGSEWSGGVLHRRWPACR